MISDFVNGRCTSHTMEEELIDTFTPGTSGQPEYIGIDKTDMEKDLTQKFLRGEITFDEYSSEWYGKDDDDGEEKCDKPSPLPQTKKGSFMSRKKYARLSPALQGLMGEANIRFVRGEKDVAEKMCYEIIRQVPTAPEPYQTLAQIYEHDPEKTLQFSLLAAHLSPCDADEWMRLAALSRAKNDSKQEMLCYSKAIKAQPQQLELHMKRLDLLTALENISYPTSSLKVTRVKCYHTIVTSLDASQGETIMIYAKMAAKLYHSTNEIERALEVMEAAYKKCSCLFTLEDTNLYLELLIARKQYQTCIEVFVANAEVDIEAEIHTISENNKIEEQTHYLNCRIPNNLPIDLRSKLLVCFIHLAALNLVKILLDDFLKNNVEKAGDLYMDVEEALSSVGQHELALKVLEPLVKNKSFDLGAVWLKHAECLYNLGKQTEAVKSYYKVLEHAPQHSDARQKLFTILESENRIEDALAILQQDYKSTVSATILYQHCCALKKHNRLEKFLEVGEAMLSKTFMKFRQQEELRYVRLARGGADLIHNFRTSRGENPFHEDDLVFDSEETFKLTPTEEWMLFKELLQIAHSFKKYYIMERLSFGALMSKSLSSHQQEIEFYCVQACLLNKDYTNAITFVKDIAQRYKSIHSWNLLNIVNQAADEGLSLKQLQRIFQKESYHTLSSIIKNMFLGNAYLISGRYIGALKYHLEYHEKCQDSLSAFLIGADLLFLGSQRTVDKHHNLILQAMSYFFKYKELRKCDQEAYYNIGRAYQMLCINNLAIEYYEKGLACPPIAECAVHGVIDLTREIAFNLCTLYKDHSPQMARKYMMKYLVI